MIYLVRGVRRGRQWDDGGSLYTIHFLAKVENTLFAKMKIHFWLKWKINFQLKWKIQFWLKWKIHFWLKWKIHFWLQWKIHFRKNSKIHFSQYSIQIQVHSLHIYSTDTDTCSHRFPIYGGFRLIASQLPSFLVLGWSKYAKKRNTKKYRKYMFR